MTNNPWLEHCPKPRRPRPSGIEFDAFLSYRSVDRRWTFALYDTLVDAGFDVFVDQVELEPGGSLRRQLQKNLEASAGGVIVWSKEASTSDWVEHELNAMDMLVKERASTAFPFHCIFAKLDAAKLPLFAADSLWADFHEHPLGPSGGELLRLLTGLVGESLGRERARFVLELGEQTKELIHKIEAARLNGDSEWIVALTQEHSLALSSTSLVLCHAAEALIELSCEALALGVLAKTKALFPKAVRPQQLEGLAYRRLGDLTKAQRILGQLYVSGHRDPETVGIYAATWAKRWEQEGQCNLLRKSQELYEEAFTLEPSNYYVGINAASKAALLGDSERAKTIAERVSTLPPVASATRGSDYYAIATHAEACLLKGETAEAAGLYEAAVSGSPFARGTHETTREQLCKLVQALHVPDSEAADLMAAFRS